jgi:hypothetical protein
MKRFLPALVLFTAILPLSAFADDGATEESVEPVAHLSRFGEGEGPEFGDGVYHLLDEKRSGNQSNAVAFDRQIVGAFGIVTLR